MNSFKCEGKNSRTSNCREAGGSGEEEVKLSSAKEVGEVGEQLLGAGGGALSEEEGGIQERLGKHASLWAGWKRGRERCLFLKAEGSAVF